ncbi:plant intracellular Ras-group-related LRR protein 6-like [Tripterygium wilfordii]|uniref:Plant intracellular Ras-group-related LRR protein 6-like n=1 Tax=Tripterygium wilfordii TaxID=458696 RepID=A0A7J7BWQ1_TRIWF|nr:plant intracellular Ras-group-related LRR protein 6-like [Tripterygium wilfordii]KAF5725966.1 plant intracellular Ras-group-related LRR protein 6-like [Tripterygium wilfordii]
MMFEQQMRIDMRKKEEKRSSSSSSPKGTTSNIEEDRLEIVDLSGMSLDSLPNPSLNLATICKLDLSNNNLQSIPESLAARLLHVVVFDIHSNQLKKLPNSIGCLSKLKVLNVSGNLLRFLPKTIENCRLLEELNANFNQLTMLPDNIGFELTNLKKISVNSNKLVFLPHSLTYLTLLRILDARLNNLRCLPDDLENLINLEVLNVSQNFQYLQSLPYSIGLLISLVVLDVSYNKITTLPDSMGCLKKLQKLKVEGNPLISPPVEVVEQNLQAIKEYLIAKMNAGHRSPAHKKKSWLGKLVKYGTFNSRLSGSREEREGFIMPEYRSIDSLASPRYMGMFSPRRLFSPRTYFMTR